MNPTKVKIRNIQNEQKTSCMVEIELPWTDFNAEFFDEILAVQEDTLTRAVENALESVKLDALGVPNGVKVIYVKHSPIGVGVYIDRKKETVSCEYAVTVFWEL